MTGQQQHSITEDQLYRIVKAKTEADRQFVVEEVLRSSPAPQPDALAELDKMFPRNTKINENGDLVGGWELDPKPLLALKKKIESNPQYEEEPEAEAIEVVILEIMSQLRQQHGGEQR